MTVSEAILSRGVAAVGSSTLEQPVIASQQMRAIHQRIARVAPTTVPVLILGETGTGKELIARAIHASSKRTGAPFIVVNCGAIPESLMESELFGHERGAFSGATARKPGPFERAAGGTLFLDEVGELSPGCQASLLRVLETRRVVRVGGTEEVAVDVRLVSATNRCLKQQIRVGRFRPDFLFRLETFTVHVPSLRERTEEIEPLARLFLARSIERWGLAPLTLSPCAIAWLRAQVWPGNVRQLKSMVERAAIDTLASTLRAADFEASELSGAIGSSRAPAAETVASEPADYPAPCESGLLERVRGFEARLIREALSKANGNQTRAAALLGIPRRTLANKVVAYGLRG